MHDYTLVTLLQLRKARVTANNILDRSSPQLHAPRHHHEELVDRVTRSQQVHARPEQLQARPRQQRIQELARRAPASSDAMQ